MNRHNLIQSTLIGASVAVVFVTLITIAGELYHVAGADGKAVYPIKDFLKSLHGHHWVGKSIWAVIVFGMTSAISYVVCRKCELKQETMQKYVAFFAFVLGLCTFIVYGFFVYEYLIK